MAELNDHIFTYGKDILPEGAVMPHKDRVCCFTGHRPEKMPDVKGFENMLSLRVQQLVIQLNRQGVDTFITGMARGFDLLAAQSVIELLGDEGVHLICAVPYGGQFREMKTEEERQIYRQLIRRADAVFCMAEGYSRGIYHVRNRFMVNYSGHLIAYLENRELTSSGSLYTVNYAKQKHRKVSVIYNDDLIG